MTKTVMAAAAIMTVALGLGTPRPSEASGYIWNVDASGSWTNASNWLHLAGTGPVGSGFPNGVGDVAFFTANYTAPRTVTIPAGVIITVGEVHYAGAHNFFLQQGVGGPFPPSLTLDNGGARDAAITHIGADGGFTFEIGVHLRDTLVVTVEQGRTISFDRLDDLTVPQAIRKRGPGKMTLTASNACRGSVTVEHGTLSLASSEPGSIDCDLFIGDGAGSVGSAEVTITQPDQIVDRVNVVVRSDGRLSCSSPDQIANLDVIDGFVTVRDTDARLTVLALTMTGGAVETASNAQLRLLGDVTATSSAVGPALIRIVVGATSPGSLSLGDSTRHIQVNDGPAAVDLDIGVPIVGNGNAGLTMSGTGTLRFSGDVANTYAGETVVLEGVMELGRTVVAVPGMLRIGDGVGPAIATVSLLASHNIHSAGDVIVERDGRLQINDRQQTLNAVRVREAGNVVIGNSGGGAGILTSGLVLEGGHVGLQQDSVLRLSSILEATSTSTQMATVIGGGRLELADGERIFRIGDGPQVVDLHINVPVHGGRAAGLLKQGAGVLRLAGTNAFNGATAVETGTLLVTGTHATRDTFAIGGTLGGTGTVGTVTVSSGTLAPGLGSGTAGRLVSGPITFTPASVFAVDLQDATPGTGYDQLDVRGPVSLGNATLSLASNLPVSTASFTILLNDGADPIAGTFAGLAEGATVTAGAHQFQITYLGGDGNDVVLTEVSALSYFLAEGATGAFFDDDVLLANPNTADAPVTLTFLLEGGSTVVEQRTVPAQSRLTVHVDQIAGLEATSASVQVTSDDRLPLIVERSMFWDASYYGGHTANAVVQPGVKWIFAEGFQGFFDTYILIANANAQATTATLTFLRENDTPIVTTVPIELFARKTIYAGDYPDLLGRAFGIVVDATLPVIAERAMYFASLPGRLWTGGHVNTGIVAPATSWFHAEGATGGFFNTFILLSNPQTTAAHVELRFLLDTGEVITRTKTIEAQQRLTINPAAEGDTRLQNAAVSTVVQADVPIVSERSMYWPGDATPFGEGHNSAGVVTTATRWGLAEGRIGGERQYDTFILLANPSTQAAQVTITYLREGGAPVVKTHAVPATSRFNIDVKTAVPELQNSSFGARIEVTNGVSIAVERSLYWNANGIFWAGGTNALATPLP